MPKYTSKFLLLFCFLVCSCSNVLQTDSDLIVFDYNQSYPEIYLRLSDVADVRYIKMGGVDKEFMISARSVLAEDFYVNEQTERIYTVQGEQLLMYDMSGNPLRRLIRVGRGPQEYLSLFSFRVDEDNNTVSVYDMRGNSFLEYDTLFNFKRKFSFKVPTIKNMMKLNGDTLLVYNHSKPYGWVDGMPRFFFLASESTAQQIKPINIYFERPELDDDQESAWILYPSLIRGKGGVFMTNKRCDTVFRIDTKSLEVKPHFVDITNYNTPECMTIPSYETADYLFLETNFKAKLSPKMEHRYFVYDKHKRQIFRLKVDNWQNPYGIQLTLVNDQCALTANLATLTEGYMAIFLSTVFLEDNMDKLPSELQEITKTMDENDNPLLMLIKLK